MYMEQEKSKIIVIADKLPDPKYKYVCWLDIMGIATILVNSIHRAANFILKFQAQVEQCIRDKAGLDTVQVYPTMDGVYITAENQAQLCPILKSI